MKRYCAVLGFIALCLMATTLVLAADTMHDALVLAPDVLIREAFTVRDAIVQVDLIRKLGGVPTDIEIVLFPSHGTIEVSTDRRRILYTPESGYFGFDVFGYVATSSGNGMETALVSVTVAGCLIAVIAVSDESSVTQSASTTIDVLGNDFSNYLLDNQVWLNVMSVSPPAHGHVEVADDGRIRYTSDAGFCGMDTFTYIAWDQHEWAAEGLVRINVMCSGNRNPAAITDYAQTRAGEPVRIDVLANDVDLDGDSLRITSITQAPHPHVSVSTDGTSLLYAPPEDWIGTVVFSYSVNDGRGGSDAALVSVDVISAETEAIP